MKQKDGRLDLYLSIIIWMLCVVSIITSYAQNIFVAVFTLIVAFIVYLISKNRELLQEEDALIR